MRQLSPTEILELSSRRGVRKTAVENFLMSMGTDRKIALVNLAADVLSYKWDSETLMAIRDGICLAQRLPKKNWEELVAAYRQYAQEEGSPQKAFDEFIRVCEKVLV